MSLQVHCDSCNKSLHTRKPYADVMSNAEPTWVRLFKDNYDAFGGRDYAGWAFCDNRCAAFYFINVQVESEAKSDSTQG